MMKPYNRDWFLSKWQTASHVAKNYGLPGVIKAGLAHIERRIFPLKQLRKWWQRWKHQDHWIIGYWVELTGNLVYIDGCKFYVDHPSIPTLLKSRMYMNRYEFSERNALRLIDSTLPVVELGGGIGVVACLANRLLAEPKNHIVIEANPEIIHLLARNRDLNKSQFQILNNAIGYGESKIALQIQRSMLDTTSRRSGIREVYVPAIDLRKIVEQFGFSTFTLICDIEGNELDMIEIEIDLVKKHVAWFILETHPEILGNESTIKVLRTLEQAGFIQTCKMDRKNFLFHNSHLDPIKP